MNEKVINFSSEKEKILFFNYLKTQGVIDSIQSELIDNLNNNSLEQISKLLYPGNKNDIHKTYKKFLDSDEINEREGIQENVHSMVQMIAKKLKLEIKKEKIPIVVPSEYYGKKTPFLHFEKNIIGLPKKECYDGIAIGEEVMHYLRHELTKSLEDTGDEDIKEAVQEFFGRLGESFAYKSTENTKLGFLFKNYRPRNWSDSSKLENNIKEIIKMKNQENENQNEYILLLDEIRDCNKELEKCDLKIQKGEISLDDFFEIVNQFSQRITKFLNNKHAEDSPLLRYLDTLVKLKQTIKIGKKSKNTESLNTKISDLIFELQRLDLSLYLTLMFTGINHEDIIASAYNHMVGYVAAELFMKNNPNWIEQFPKLLGLESQEILEKFIETEENNNWFNEHNIRELINMNVGVQLGLEN